jgi:hypothetical protein
VVLTEEESTQELQLRLTRVLKDLMKPVKVKSLTVTGADRYSVRGVLMTVCPIEKTVSGKDFEAGLAGNHRGSIRYVTVDGRRLLPRKTPARASRRGSGSR